jgi:hypothetical protein
MVRSFIRQKRKRARIFEDDLFIKQADDSGGLRGINQNEFSSANEREKGKAIFHHRMINKKYKNIWYQLGYYRKRRNLRNFTLHNVIISRFWCNSQIKILERIIEEEIHKNNSPSNELPI